MRLCAPQRRGYNTPMPKLTVEEVGQFEVPQGKRLVNALEDEAGIDQLHACGGNARCTTCRVQFVAGEPAKITQAEKDLLAARGRVDAGKRPADEIMPPPAWTTKE